MITHSDKRTLLRLVDDRLYGSDGDAFYEQLKALHDGRLKPAEPFSVPNRRERRRVRGVLRGLVERERFALQKFFGEVHVPEPLPVVVTVEKYTMWRQFGYDLHWLPPVTLDLDAPPPGWKVLPSLSSVALVRFDDPAPLTLPGCWMLVDERTRPAYQGYPRYSNDEVIESLFTNGSRFNHSWFEVRAERVRAKVGFQLHLDPALLRLPRMVEWMYLGNVFHLNLTCGVEKNWEWLEDSCDRGRRQLYVVGNIEEGGLVSMEISGPDFPNSRRGFRLVAPLR